jgi:hypothetical protein
MPDAMQISLTGEEVPIQVPEPHKPPTRKYRTMQQLHGTTPRKICGDCEHFIRHRWDKVYFKCELWHMSHSAATDIRKKDQACGLFKERVSEDGSSKDA